MKIEKNNIPVFLTGEQSDNILNAVYHPPRRYCWIDMGVFPCPDCRAISLQAFDFATRLLIQTGLNWNFDLCYNIRKIFLYCEGFLLKAKFLVQIPYRNRSRYLPVVKQINRLVEREGVCGMFVNNNPYSLEALLVIETGQDPEKIKRLVKESGLSARSDKGINELTEEMLFRRWNSSMFRAGNDKDVEDSFRYLFSFRETSELEQDGYEPERQVFRPKMFVSYCHADKEHVVRIVEGLKQYGIYVWIDYDEIDLGENILDRVSHGIAESDMALIFLSHNTRQALFAQYELQTWFSKVIRQKSKIVPVLLEQMDPNEFYEGLGDILYYPFYQTPDIEQLAGQLQKLLNQKQRK